VNRSLTTLLCNVIQKNLRSLEEYFMFIEFAYNKSMHSTSNHSPFEIVYIFNSLTPLNILPLPVAEKVDLDINNKAKMVKKRYESV